MTKTSKSAEELAKRLKEEFETGDRIVAVGRVNNLPDEPLGMPLPVSASRGMSIADKDDINVYWDAFLEGHSAVFYALSADYIEIEYGGKVTMYYEISERSLKEYGVALEDYASFVSKLENMGFSVSVTPGGE